MAWCIESDPLIEPVEILGFPMVRLRVEVDQPDAFIAVRLCDVAPDGSSVLVTRGILNLTHRHGHDRLTPLPMGEAFDVEFRLDAAGHRFRPGHRVRVAMSTTYWPWIWPSPTPVTMIVLAGEVTLPMVAADSTPADLGEPDAGTAADIEFLDAGGDPNRPDFLLGRLMIRDLGLISHDEGSNTYTLDEGDPLSARVRIIRRSAVARDGWSTIVEADAEMTCSATSFRVESHLAAWHDDVEVFRRIDVTVVPRATGRW